MARDIDTRAVTLVDLPLIRRLGSKATVLDSTIEFTQETYEPNTSTLTNMFLPQRTLHTLVTRSDKDHVIGQFRLPNDGQNAQITYIAPGLKHDSEDTAWLHLLDAMAREAGQRHAHALIAEVREDDSLFETMRTAGFAVYARRQIWRRLPGTLPTNAEDHNINLREATDADAFAIQSLTNSIVPALMQPFVMPVEEMIGWVWRVEERVRAYIAVAMGKQGIYLMPFIEPTYMDDALAILTSLMWHLQKCDKLPVYVCVSRYQEWISTSLRKLDFQPGPRQAVMVRHITAGVRQATFKSVFEKAEGRVTAGLPKPPTNHTRNYRHDHAYIIVLARYNMDLQKLSDRRR